MRKLPFPTLDQVISLAVQSALMEAKGNKVHAARMLGISRGKLYRMIAEYGIEDSK
jgi:DNA-binding NtrC family response regulator